MILSYSNWSGPKTSSRPVFPHLQSGAIPALISELPLLEGTWVCDHEGVGTYWLTVPDGRRPRANRSRGMPERHLPEHSHEVTPPPGAAHAGGRRRAMLCAERVPHIGVGAVEDHGAVTAAQRTRDG